MSLVFGGDFDQNSGIIFAIFATGIWILIIFVYALIAYDMDWNHPVRKVIIAAVCWWVFPYAALNGIVWGISSSAMNQVSVNSSVFPKSFGFESGKSYPLILGSRITGASGSIDVESGFFYTNVSGTFAPASSLSIGFEQDNRSYILEIPTEHVTFIQDDTASPSIILNLDKDSLNSDYGNFTYDTTYGPCKLVINNGWWGCEKRVVQKNFNVPEYITKDGLAPIVKKAFTNAQITLTHEMYQTILNEG